MGKVHEAEAHVEVKASREAKEEALEEAKQAHSKSQQETAAHEKNVRIKEDNLNRKESRKGV